jgi:cell division protein FtsX
MLKNMKLEDYKNLTKDILSNLSDQAKVSEILMQLNDVYGTQLAEKDQLSTKVTEQEGNIKSLQQTNMNLFLKVANPIPAAAVEDPKTETISYDDLLKEWT